LSVGFSFAILYFFFKLNQKVTNNLHPLLFEAAEYCRLYNCNGQLPEPNRNPDNLSFPAHQLRFYRRWM